MEKENVRRSVDAAASPSVQIPLLSNVNIPLGLHRLLEWKRLLIINYISLL